MINPVFIVYSTLILTQILKLSLGIYGQLEFFEIQVSRGFFSIYFSHQVTIYLSLYLILIAAIIPSYLEPNHHPKVTIIS